ncbi:hypothetical protein DFAR_1030005 [Desulfarculales bacterium]
MIQTEEQLAGQRLAPGEIFNFACHPGLACFNTWCANKRLPVLPYDLLRLRRGLGLKSPDALERLLELDLDPVSGWPVLRLKLMEKSAAPCWGQRAARSIPTGRQLAAPILWLEPWPQAPGDAERARSFCARKPQPA